MQQTRRLPDPIILESGGEINTGTTTYTFPPADGSLNQVLTTNGSGQLVWQNATSAPTVTPRDVYTHYTINDTDNFIRYRGALAGTITLPGSAAYPGRQIYVEHQSAANVPVTIAGTGTDTIDGDASIFTLEVQFESASLVSDGLGNWLLI